MQPLLEGTFNWICIVVKNDKPVHQPLQEDTIDLLCFAINIDEPVHRCAMNITYIKVKLSHCPIYITRYVPDTSTVAVNHFPSRTRGSRRRRATG
jgi:hypothetical protein